MSVQRVRNPPASCSAKSGARSRIDRSSTRRSTGCCSVAATKSAVLMRCSLDSLCSRGMLITNLRGLDHVLEECAVMDHGLPEVLGDGLSARRAAGYVMRGAVMLDDV